MNLFTSKTYETQQALKDVSFEIKKGDFFGVVGRNGSGKSTLLKLMAGIYTPTEGEVAVKGSLIPFIELGVGFNHELSGRENVFLNGALLGFTRKQMHVMYDEIVEFAELERFMDQKLKNYSSGMQVRLAFSIAIQAKSDILVLDEVLAVGDEAFQRKCFSYFAQLKRDKKTVILVTHAMDSVQQFCDRAMLIEDSKIVKIGNPSVVAGEYMELNSVKTTGSDKTVMRTRKGVSAQVKLRNTGDSLIFNIEVSSTVQLDDAVITFMINSDSGAAVYRWATDDDSKGNIVKQQGKTKIKLELDNIFPDGDFDVQLALKKRDRSEIYALFNRALTFRIKNQDIKKRNNQWKPKEKYSYE